MSAPTWRLLTDEEVAAYHDAEPDEVLHPPPHRYRWHCTCCGHFVPFATVHKVPVSGPDWIDEHEYTGECKTHGKVDVTWGQQ